MTVLFFTRLFYPHIGGVEKHVLEVGKRLVKLGYKVVVVTEELATTNIPIYLHQYQQWQKREILEELGIHKIPVGKDDWFKKFRIWWWLCRHRQLIEQADIIHCHDVFFWYLPFRFLYPKKPVYTTFHGYETKFPPTKRAIFWRKIAEKLSLGNICVGDYISKWYGTKPTFVTYGGVNQIKNSRLRQGFGGQEKLKILFLGRLEKDTGLLQYFKVIKCLREQNLDLKFEFLGEGSLRKKAEKWGRVHGFVKNIEPYLAQARFVFTSSYLSILEAMAQKKLVFAVYENPLKEDYLKLAPFSKWIIAAFSLEQLYNKLTYYTQHPGEEKKMVEEAYNWVREQTWDKIIETYLKLWKYPEA